jgi:hypothetical protein
MKRIIIQGAMSHASGADITKLATTTAGIQKKAWDISAGMLKTAIMPTPKMAAFLRQDRRGICEADHRGTTVGQVLGRHRQGA